MSNMPGSKLCVKVVPNQNQIVLSKLSDPSDNPKAFTYDSVYDMESTQ